MSLSLCGCVCLDSSSRAVSSFHEPFLCNETRTNIVKTTDYFVYLCPYSYIPSQSSAHHCHYLLGTTAPNWKMKTAANGTQHWFAAVKQRGGNSFILNDLSIREIPAIFKGYLVNKISPNLIMKRKSNVSSDPANVTATADVNVFIDWRVFFLSSSTMNVQCLETTSTSSRWKPHHYQLGNF